MLLLANPKEYEALQRLRREEPEDGLLVILMILPAGQDFTMAY